MRDGFIKVAALTPKIRVADPEYNTEVIKAGISEASEKGAKIIVTPELGLSGYTCNDLFLHKPLLDGCVKGLCDIADFCVNVDALVFVGLPIYKDGKLYNVAAAINRGDILCFIPKVHIPNYGEFYELRYFAPGNKTPLVYDLFGDEIPFGTNILLKEENTGLDLKIACELCEDLWAPNPPSTAHAMAGANVIVNLSASDENVAKDEYRKSLVAMTSARLLAGYIYCSAGEGESTQDLVFGGHDIIAENGTILGESKLFETGITYADIDVERLNLQRVRMTSFDIKADETYLIIPFAVELEETQLNRFVDKAPFVPSDESKRNKRCEKILSIQAMGLKKRLEHTGVKSAVVGISGGLDSTLALLVTVRAFDMLGLDRQGIVAVTMPCFGTTDRTYDNACTLIKELGVKFEEINIEKAVRQHFSDIGHDESVHNVTYENGQARQRTYILMDIANRENGLVIGTGDMSELALGWATYNGDHMSMYGVNCGVPKTLVRHLVKYYADIEYGLHNVDLSDANNDMQSINAISGSHNSKLADILYDILDTPVSPELLPPENGVISQKTEDLVGPYELHDFFLYYLMKFGFRKDKIYRLAKAAFAGEYDDATIDKWLTTFMRRFFSQQFKRSCLPDGPKVGSIALSPRGDLRMPSDASNRAWMG